MKIRNSFVSNSSSSSFIIKKCYLTPEQIEYIRDHKQHGLYFGIDYSDDYWAITEDDSSISGYTSMDNFDMSEFLDKIGVKGHIEWGEETSIR
jgi:hypothetical protein